MTSTYISSLVKVTR